MMHAVALSRWAGSQVGRAWVWGETDCASLVRRGLAVWLGEERLPAAPEYSSRIGAFRALARTGGVDRVLRAAGWTEHPLAEAGIGDVAIQPGPSSGDLMPGCGLYVPGGILSSRYRHPARLFRLTDLRALYALRAP